MQKLLILLLALLLPLCALADTAQDLTGACTLSFSGGIPENLTDKSTVTACTLPEARNHYVTVIPGDTPVCGLYLVMGTHQKPFIVQTQAEDGTWLDLTDKRAAGRYQEYVTFPAQTKPFRLWFHRDDNEPTVLDLRELYLLGEGDADESVIHNWNYETKKADLLVVVAHPDDELLWLGGMIPYYAVERGMAVQVCYMTCESPTRHLELLDGLWACGVRDYPAVGTLPDRYTDTMTDCIEKWGEARAIAQMVTWLRQYRPEAVVTHDLKGEYGHGAHRATSHLMEKAVQLAASREYDGASLALGVHQVKKLYRHLGASPTTVLDWSTPIAALGGRNGYEVAEDAFACHTSQTAKSRYAVARAGDAYDSTIYTLVFSTVGQDEAGNDIFENIP